MLKVGITGSQGSGKTFISSQFAKLGIPIYNSDERAKWVNNNIPQLKSEIISEFGDVYVNDQLDKFKIRKIVFSEDGADKLKILENICHPYVLDDFNKFCYEHKNSPFIIAESAILFESGFYKNMDKIIFVDVRYSIRLERTLKRDNITAQEYDNRMKGQMSPFDKRELCDFIIDNSVIEPRTNEVKKIFDILVNTKKFSNFV
jgi:dephospho-CoA kinase